MTLPPPDDNPGAIPDAEQLQDKLQKMALGMNALAGFTKTTVDAHMAQGFSRPEAIDIAKAMLAAMVQKGAS